jgi:hypothetical protein
MQRDAGFRIHVQTLKAQIAAAPRHAGRSVTAPQQKGDRADGTHGVELSSPIKPAHRLPRFGVGVGPVGSLPSRLAPLPDPGRNYK